MLKVLRYLAVLVLVLGSIWILATSSSFRSCMEKQTQTRAEQAKKDPPPFALALTNVAAICVRCGGHVVYEYRDFVTAVATAFIAIFTYTLYAATKGLAQAAQIQSDDMKRSIVATEISATAAQKSADTAEHALKSVERARLSIEGFESVFGLSASDPKVVEFVNLRPVVRNGGRLPALRVNGWSKFEEFDASKPIPPNLFSDMPQSPYIGAGQIGNGTTGLIGGFGVKIGQLEAAWRKTNRIIVCALVEYDDGFDDTPRRQTVTFLELIVTADPINLADRNIGSKIFQWLAHSEDRSKAT